MAVKTFYCTTCPSECHLTVTFDDAGEVASVAGNRCPRGEAFGRQEATCPVRVLTSTVCIEGAGNGEPLVPVRTASAIPLSKQAAAMEEVRKVVLHAPVHMGDTVARDIAGTGIDLVASCDAR